MHKWCPCYFYHIGCLLHCSVPLKVAANNRNTKCSLFWFQITKYFSAVDWVKRFCCWYITITTSSIIVYWNTRNAPYYKRIFNCWVIYLKQQRFIPELALLGVSFNVSLVPFFLLLPSMIIHLFMLQFNLVSYSSESSIVSVSLFLFV